MPGKDKGKAILHEVPKMTLNIQCFKCQDFGNISFSYPNKALFIKDQKDMGEEYNYYDKVYELNPYDFQDLNDEEDESNLLRYVRFITI
jgi:hypothetical protein